MNPNDLATILQASIAPCVLISGVGLLLLALSNRLGRPIDLTRKLCDEMRHAPTDEKRFLAQQIGILYRRCGLLRLSVLFASLSIALVGLIILAFFAKFAGDFWLPYLIEALFILSLSCLIVSLLYFMTDVSLALRSLKIEVFEHTGLDLTE